MSSRPKPSHRARWTLLAALLGLLSLSGGRTGAADATAGAAQAVYLDYAELGSRIKGWRLNITPQTAPFQKEPDWGGRHICRGTINSAFQGVEKPGTPPGHTINLPFAWDYTRGKLYLDIKRSGDLPDSAVFSTTPGKGDYFYQDFTNIHLTFPGQARAHPVLVDIALYAYKGKDISGGNLTWHSYWQGKAVLQGRECQIGLIEHPNHLGTTAEGDLLLRLWAQHEQPFSVEDGLLTGFEYCTNLFAYGQAYHLACVYVPGDIPRFKLDLSKAQPELGAATLTGKFIRRAVLWGHQAKVPYTVVLDWPEANVRIPVGTYTRYWVALHEEIALAFSDYRDWAHPKPVTISATTPTALNMGGPLTNWVAATSQGRFLTLDYQLRGAGGRYRLAGSLDRGHPPQLDISQKGKPVFTGKFQYG